MWPISVQSKCMTTFEVLHWESSFKACKSVQLEGLSWYDPKSIRNIIPSFCQDDTDNHFGRCVSCSVQDFVEIELRACVSFSSQNWFQTVFAEQTNVLRWFPYWSNDVILRITWPIDFGWFRPYVRERMANPKCKGGGYELVRNSKLLVARSCNVSESVDGNCSLLIQLRPKDWTDGLPMPFTRQAG